MATLYYLNSSGSYVEFSENNHSHTEFVLKTGDIVTGNVVVKASANGKYGTDLGNSGGYSIVRRTSGEPYLILAHDNDANMYLNSGGDLYVRPDNDSSVEINFSDNGKIYAQNEIQAFRALRGINGDRAFLFLNNSQDFYPLIYTLPGHQWGDSPSDFPMDRPFKVQMGDAGKRHWSWIIGTRDKYERGFGVDDNGIVLSNGILAHTNAGSYVRVFGGDQNFAIQRFSSSLSIKKDITFVTNPKTSLVPNSRSAPETSSIDVEDVLNIASVTFRSDIPADSPRTRVGFIAENIDNVASWANSGTGYDRTERYPDLPAINAAILAVIQRRLDTLDQLEQRLSELEQIHGR